jgi:hypothetical protein
MYIIHICDSNFQVALTNFVEEFKYREREAKPSNDLTNLVFLF